MITQYSVHRASQMFINTLNNTDVYYDALSALQKSIRASDPNAALFYLEALLETGVEPVFICRRLMVISAEDVGLGNPVGLIQAANALRAVETLLSAGYSNSDGGTHSGDFTACKNVLTELTVFLANSPKDNSTYIAHFAAQDLAKHLLQRQEGSASGLFGPTAERELAKSVFWKKTARPRP